jgi:hypothetical protein
MSLEMAYFFTELATGTLKAKTSPEIESTQN